MSSAHSRNLIDITVCRLMRHAKLKFDMLARHGPVVLIPYYECNPECVRARLEEAIGLPLYEAFAKSALPQQGMLFDNGNGFSTGPQVWQ